MYCGLCGNPDTVETLTISNGRFCLICGGCLKIVTRALDRDDCCLIVASCAEVEAERVDRAESLRLRKKARKERKRAKTPEWQRYLFQEQEKDRRRIKKLL